MRPAAALAERLGLPVRDLDLLQQALIHSSYLHEHRDLAAGHNERLEFLGDSVVSLAISDALYRRHPDDDEGVLSARRASIVSTAGLARLASRLELGEYLLLGEGEVAARRPPTAGPARLRLRGPRRRLVPRSGVRSRQRVRDCPGRARADERSSARCFEEPEEPPPGVHPAPLGRAAAVPPDRRRRSGPRQGLPSRGGGRRSGRSASAEDIRAAWPRRKPPPTGSKRCASAPGAGRRQAEAPELAEFRAAMARRRRRPGEDWGASDDRAESGDEPWTEFDPGLAGPNATSAGQAANTVRRPCRHDEEPRAVRVASS